MKYLQALPMSSEWESKYRWFFFFFCVNSRVRRVCFSGLNTNPDSKTQLTGNYLVLDPIPESTDQMMPSLGNRCRLPEEGITPIRLA